MYEKVCRTCGKKLSEFYNTSMLGCPDCYIAFRQEINGALKNIQGAVVHMGKKPKINGVDRDLLREYDLLLKEKEQAGLNQDFSRVAELSKDIYELQLELKRRGLI
ncbi:MAG: hypothetical protein IJB32_03625 [Clostridia bacterium]|nr:hypothetical protein [Clostridia bacterium]